LSGDGIRISNFLTDCDIEMRADRRYDSRKLRAQVGLTPKRNFDALSDVPPHFNYGNPAITVVEVVRCPRSGTDVLSFGQDRDSWYRGYIQGRYDLHRNRLSSTPADDTHNGKQYDHAGEWTHAKPEQYWHHRRFSSTISQHLYTH
jgi:hypothetical protein